MAHTLTFSESDFSDVGITVLVNGTSVSSPYILKNGDYITLDSAATIAVNGTSYQNNAALSLSDTDIAVTRGIKPNRYVTSPAITINYTETVSRKSIDLTTLPGWSSLSSGSHSITIVAKADGYRDSEPSAAVSVEKGPQEYTDCITFTGETSDFTLAVGSDGAKEWNGTVEYSTDHNTWTTWNGAAISSVNKKLYLRGSGNTKFFTGKGARLQLSVRAACSGNIQTLLDYSNPPTTLATSCYAYMFRGCANLTTAPELPATTLATSCYSNMFSRCTSLTTAPELPAITLVSSCYSYMFYGCTSLTQAPELPATTLADACYMFMFQNCTSLKISTVQSTEYPTAWRIPSSGTISSTATNWNNSMLSGTGGTFTSNPSINTTYYGAWQSSAPTLISFTIAGTSYQAEEGMTWEQWVNSSYNTGNFALNGSYVWDRNGLYVSTQNSPASKYYVGINASIANGGTFYLASTESGGSGK